MFVLFNVFFALCRSVYCLCVNGYCTTATGWQTNCSLTNISYIISHVGSDSSDILITIRYTKSYSNSNWAVVTSEYIQGLLDGREHRKLCGILREGEIFGVTV
jgi:hypothetical protein